MKSKQESPAFQLVRLVYTEGQRATGHSWIRLNQALYHAAMVAIEGGLVFSLDDFTALYAQTRASYWIGSNPEGLYAAACRAGNLSACRAYEHHYGFAPYELDGQRVFVGHDFVWNGEQVKCTSILKERLVACSYGPHGEAPLYTRKLLHRYSITPAQMRAEEKQRQETKADKKMEAAQAKAKAYAKTAAYSEESLGLRVLDYLEKIDLMPHEKERLREILTKRFRKTDKPTVLDLLTVGCRWSADYMPAIRYAEKIATICKKESNK